MTLTIRPIDPARPGFAGEVSGIDLRRPISAEEARAVDAGMDQYGVLVFHDQQIDDQQQLAFTRHFGPIDPATGDIAQGAERRLSMEVNDISNLDKNNNVLERDNRRRLFSLGNQLWHSDSSFRAVPAKYSILSCR
ncbi:MAG: TauD/TfdA family dioxygenase, partial [Alphaproteobacteria bacterium]|nr:TauD/TfdA family dioxygenase [Alphaproteobacteria bacterium]